MWHTDIRKASKRYGEEVKADVRETHKARKFVIFWTVIGKKR